ACGNWNRTTVAHGTDVIQPGAMSRRRPVVVKGGQDRLAREAGHGRDEDLPRPAVVQFHEEVYKGPASRLHGEQAGVSAERSDGPRSQLLPAAAGPQTMPCARCCFDLGCPKHFRQGRGSAVTREKPEPFLLALRQRFGLDGEAPCTWREIAG